MKIHTKNTLQKNKRTKKILLCLVLALFSITLFILSIIALRNGPLALFYVYGGLCCFLSYMLFIELRGPKDYTNIENKYKQISILKSMLTEKNFLNHHNYYRNHEHQTIYHTFILKRDIKNGVWTSILIAIMSLLGILPSLWKEMTFAMGLTIFLIISGLLITHTIGKNIWIYIKAQKSPDKRIYQSSVRCKHFEDLYGKIFFYNKKK